MSRDFTKHEVVNISEHLMKNIQKLVYKEHDGMKQDKGEYILSAGYQDAFKKCIKLKLEIEDSIYED